MTRFWISSAFVLAVAAAGCTSSAPKAAAPAPRSVEPAAQAPVAGEAPKPARQAAGAEWDELLEKLKQNYSISEQQSYFVSTGGGLNILQTLVGPLDLVFRGSRERMAYPTTTVTASRADVARTWGGGISLRISTQARVGFNYDNSRRRSTGGRLFEYERRHIYTTVTYGF